MTASNTSPPQLGFDDLLKQADDDNHARRIEQETAHLPSSFEEGLAYYRDLIQRHHAAILAADADETLRLRAEAHKLALRLNHGDPGILADDDSAGRALERAAASAPGEVPVWGQKGEFAVDVNGMLVRVEIEGMFGCGSWFHIWPGFSTHAVDLHKPFLSQTGYRSFLGVHADMQPGITPDLFIRNVIGTYVQRELKGKLVAIGDEYRQRRQKEEKANSPIDPSTVGQPSGDGDN